MNLQLHIVGLRYNSLGSRLDEVFTHDGTLSKDFQGKDLLLRRDDCDRADYAVAAFFDGQRVGYVSDDEKSLPWQLIGEQTPQCLTMHLTTGSRSGRYIMAETYIGEPQQAGPQQDHSAFTNWAEAHRLLPVMQLTPQENLLQSEADYLELRLQQGSVWDADMDSHYGSLCNLIYLDLSQEMYAQKHRILKDMAKSTDTGVRAHMQEFYSVMIHLGSEEMRRRFAHQWLTDLRQSAEFESLCRRTAYLTIDELREAVESFPRHLYADYLNSADEAIASLYYLRLPRQVCRRWLTAVLLMEQRQRDAVAALGKETVKGFTCGQACILYYYLFDVHDVNFINSMKKDWISLISKVTGYSPNSVKEKLNFQSNIGNTQVQRDLVYVAQVLEPLFPKMAERIKNEVSTANL